MMLGRSHSIDALKAHCVLYLVSSGWDANQAFLHFLGYGEILFL